MSLAIVLGAWTVTSIVVTPLIGRFLFAFDGASPAPAPRRSDEGRYKPTVWIKRRYTNANMRRNVAVHLHRRQAGWPRVG